MVESFIKETMNNICSYCRQWVFVTVLVLPLKARILSVSG